MARVFEEKGHILRILGEDVTKTNEYNVQSTQCFNSALALMVASGDTSRKDMVERMLDELMSNPVTVEQIKLQGKFDKDIPAIETEDDAKEVIDTDAEEADQTTLYATVGLLAAAGALGIWYALFKRN